MVNARYASETKRSWSSPGARREEIVDLLRQRERVSVEELAALLASSRETVRRDLSLLASERRIRKLHGGAALPDVDREGPFAERMTVAVREKRMIAARAAALFHPGDTIFIDHGSTTLVFAEALGARGGVTVITNGVEIGRVVAAAGGQAFMLGGRYRAEVGETLGPLTIEQIERFNATHAVLTVGALGVGGAMDFDLEEAQVARAMIRQADSVTILADSSKLGRSTLFSICALADIDRLVTDCPPADPVAGALQREGVELIVAAVASN